MLVLTRKVDEKIRIGKDITIMIIETRAGSVRLGIQAPKSVEVHRDEIYQRIHGDLPEGTKN